MDGKMMFSVAPEQQADPSRLCPGFPQQTLGHEGQPFTYDFLFYHLNGIELILTQSF
jgi:hypothetical protein